MGASVCYCFRRTLIGGGKVMGTICYVCASCEEYNPEGSCYPRDMVRVMPGGEWLRT